MVKSNKIGDRVMDKLNKFLDSTVLVMAGINLGVYFISESVLNLAIGLAILAFSLR